MEPVAIETGDADRFQNDEPYNDVEEPRKVIMALDIGNDEVMGCAFFDSVDGSLNIAEDIPHSSSDVSQHFAIHANPTLLLASSRAPLNFLASLERYLLPCQSRVRVLSSSEFSAAKAVSKLSALQTDQYSKKATGSELPAGLGVYQKISMADSDLHELNFSGNAPANITTDLRNTVSLGCASAVLSELGRGRNVADSPASGPSAIQINRVKSFTLKNYVFIGPETLQSLQIFQSELHPNSQSWGVRKEGHGEKESLSIYGLLQDLCHTPQGRYKLHQILMRPISNVGIIKDRQQAIALFLRPQNGEKVQQIVGVLRKIRNARNYVNHLQKGISFVRKAFKGSVWITLRIFVAQALKLRELINALVESRRQNFVLDIASQFDQRSLVAVGELISSTIDFEQSEYRERPTVRLGIYEDLDRLKRHYDGMNSFLAEVVQRTIQASPSWAASYIRSCIFLPQLGFLLAIELDPETGYSKYRGERENGDCWEQLFVADGAVHYKNNDMRHLDEQFGDIYCEIADREVEILHILAQEVLKYSDTLLLASDASGDFDAILAMALAAEKYNWTAPTLTARNGVLEITKGRHPLQELVVPSFIPNDCRLRNEECDDDQSTPCMVLTGPNHSGKSVYLKQVALIVYLAHVGSFVPAELAVIGITDRILTRISTRESVCKEDSAFGIDLKQLHYAMKHLTPQSLLIIDEFGNGTNPDDGAGLLASFLEYVQSLKAEAPRSLLATHMHDLFDDPQLSLARSMSLTHMEITKTPSRETGANHVTYLFKLQDGYISTSFGGYCATLNGVPNPVVERADALSLLLSRHEDIRVPCTKLTSDEEQRLQWAESVARKFLEESFHEPENDEDPPHLDPQESLRRVLAMSSHMG